MALMLNISSDAASIAFRVFCALRMELLFALVFGLLYLLGQSSRARLAQAKGGGQKARAAAACARGPRQARAVAAVRPVQQARVAGQDGAQRELPRGAARLVPEVGQLCRASARRGLEAYRAARRAGLSLQELPPAECQQLFTSLVAASIRAGDTEAALQLLRELRAEGPGVGASLLASAAKLCTSKQHFAECLAIYDCAAGGSCVPVDDRSVWSCLLFCAVEAKCYERCPLFFERLKRAGQPSSKDYGNMVRFAAAKGDSQLTLQLVQGMRSTGVEIDSIVYNTALATFVATEQLEQAAALLEEMERMVGAADVITYNTLAKGYGRAGLMDRCLELFERMRSRGVEPSQVSYGILLDGYINAKQVDRVAEVYGHMIREGCTLNTVLYTTLIKGFARANQVDQAMRVYSQMCGDNSVTPDLVTFGILIKANCDCQRLEAALQLFKAMVELGLKPDEIIYNNLIGGCVTESRIEVAKQLYREMIAAGVRPSSATFSILIRLYTQSKLFNEALELLRSEPAAQGLAPEPRLFLQLISSCLRDRLGRCAVDAYALMLECCRPTAAMNGTVLGTCGKLNMLETGAELLGIIAGAKGRVNEADAAALLEAAARKRKTDCMEACSKAMMQLDLDPRQRDRHQRLREG